jgi:nitrite reductase/ring-hydroxylating ferredoxin subunit/uncharacterized membrane protein
MPGFREMMNDVIQTIEGIDALDDFSSPLSGWVHSVASHDAVKSALSGTWLGHQLHPVLTDLPIGAWTMATAIDCTAGAAGAEEARRLVGLGVLAALPAAATGASDWADTYGASQRIGLVHAVSNVSATLLQAASWDARRRGYRRVGIGLSGAGLGLVAFASYLGGHLSFVQGVGVNHTAFQPTVKKWTDIAALSELSPDQPVRVVAGRVPVVLVKHDGVVYALSATCVHAGGPLDEGKVLPDGCIRCPWHASTFQLLDGAVVRGPASLDQPSWEVKVEGDRVSVRSSRPSKKD